ncbi:hypothetical protein [Chryseobacterium sp. FH1]|uniref:hypothetical protein n=1 Tax=Chryseobacterium sp. FH1 TaxID=1233951 RepID=UPI0004E388D8|nr:hypothetical protein [Chryseobacterium sp. FH1]KFC20017.1 hypothetical protein IO90_12460 [Chryseobacterium sp. FH1]
MKILLLFISLLFTGVYQAQLCIIDDNDGYTNVREKTYQNSKIIGKIVEHQVFAIDSYVQDEENKSKDWIAVKFPLNINENLGFTKFEGEEKTGYIHKSRLVELESLPKFEKKELNPNKASHRNKDFEIIIETLAFNKSKHKITQSDKGFYNIDDEKVFNYYGGDTTEIKNITVKSKNRTYNFPKSSFKNLMGTDAENSLVYIGNKGELYIVLNAGDGGDSYNITFCVKDNKLISRTITSTIP